MTRIEPAEHVHSRLRGYQEREVCACEDCAGWGVSEPPVWVPTAAARIDGRWTRMAQQLHGRELLEHLRAAHASLDYLRNAKIKRMDIDNDR